MIQLQNATFSYPFQPAPSVQEVDLTVAPGEILLLTGPSGCGKSTVVRMVNGLALHHFRGSLSGRVLVGGRSVDQLEASDISTQVGTLFQDPEAQFFALNVRDEIAMGHEWRQVPAEETERRISRAAEQFGLDDILDRSILTLSEGQKQKVALASIMSLGPRALILDEPSANLDPESTEALARILGQLKAQGVAILIVDHRLYWLRHLADRVAVMDQGRIVAQGAFDIVDDAVLCQRHGLRQSCVIDPRPRLLPPMAAEGPAIRLRGLSFAHGRQNPIFDGASLDLPMGQVIGLLGPNGTGKTTLAMLLTGLLKADKGQLSFNGQNLKPAELLRKTSVILQNTDHQLHMQTVSAEVAASLPRERRSEQAGRVRSLLEKYNIAHLAERHPQSLSGGEKQRLVIACGEAKNPEVLILDEPTSGLDGANMRLISDCARDFARRGACVLLISHDLELLNTACLCAITMPLQPATPKSTPMTTQSPHQQAVRERIADNPSTMPDVLAGELGISEAEVIRYLPDGMWTEAPADDFETIWKTMVGWEQVTFIARNSGAVLEVSGALPNGSFAHGMFNLTDRNNPLRGHLLVNRLGSIFLVSKPFFKLESHSVQFFDVEGQPMFAVYVGRDESRALLPSVLQGFLELRGRYRQQEGV